MPQQRMIVMRGLPGSGKSTLRNQLLAQAEADDEPMTYVNKDELRELPELTTEKMVHRKQRDIIFRALYQGMSIIVDNTNLTPGSIGELQQIAAQIGVPMEVIDLTETVSMWQCIERDQERRMLGQRYVGRSVIIRMAMRAEVFQLNSATNQAVIFDIDGTLANITHRRHHVMGPNKNWAKFNAAMADDAVNESIAELYHMVEEFGQHHIILTSGRGEEFRRVTEDWLEQHGLDSYFALFMRPWRDSRQDSSIKAEIYEELIRPHFEVKWVVDDRDQVVNMWRSQMGLTVLQCAEGNF